MRDFSTSFPSCKLECKLMLERGYLPLRQEWKQLAKKGRGEKGKGAWFSDGLSSTPSPTLSHSRLFLFRLPFYEREISFYLGLLFRSSL